MWLPRIVRYSRLVLAGRAEVRVVACRSLSHEVNDDESSGVPHVSVLLHETLEAMRGSLEPPPESRIYVDCTFGAGGHSRKLLGTLGSALCWCSRQWGLIT